VRTLRFGAVEAVVVSVRKALASRGDGGSRRASVAADTREGVELRGSPEEQVEAVVNSAQALLDIVQQPPRDGVVERVNAYGHPLDVVLTPKLRRPSGPPHLNPILLAKPTVAPAGEHSHRLAYSVGALLLAISLWIILASGVGQPARAADALTFLGAPALLAGRFLHALGPLETAVVGLGCAAATWGIVAASTLAAGLWSPESALLALSGLVALVAVLDLSWHLKRRPGRDAL
jgi:hypothetical protein